MTLCPYEKGKHVYTDTHTGRKTCEDTQLWAKELPAAGERSGTNLFLALTSWQQNFGPSLQNGETINISDCGMYFVVAALAKKIWFFSRNIVYSDWVYKVLFLFVCFIFSYTMRTGYFILKIKEPQWASHLD